MAPSIDLSIQITHFFQQKAGNHPTYPFTVDRFEVIPTRQQELPHALGKLLLSSYRDKEMLKAEYRGKTKEELLVYLENYVFPTDREGRQNASHISMVKTGDFGEAIFAKVADEFHGLLIPFQKISWKLRSDKASFCTDVFGHNIGEPIRDLHYYEVKTRTTHYRAASRRREGTHLVGVVGHDSLAHDHDSPVEQISDFLRRQFYENAALIEAAGNEELAAANRSKAAQYGNIVDNRGAYTRNYCVALVLDATQAFREEIIQDLQALPPELTPMRLSIVFLEDLPALMEAAFKAAFEVACAYVFEANP